MGFDLLTSLEIQQSTPIHPDTQNMGTGEKQSRQRYEGYCPKIHAEKLERQAIHYKVERQ